MLKWFVSSKLADAGKRKFLLIKKAGRILRNENSAHG